MTDIIDRLNDSLSAAYSELREEAAQEILQLRKERDELRHRLALESQENGALRDSVDRACEERDDDTRWFPMVAAKPDERGRCGLHIHETEAHE